MLPVRGEDQQRAEEVLRLGILAAARVCRIAVAVLDLHNLAVLHMRCAVPRLNDEAVLRQHIAKDDDLVVRAVVARKHLPHCRHPSADEALEALVRALPCQLLEVLHGVISACVAAGIDGHRVTALARTDKGLPARPEVRVRRAWMKRVHRRRGVAHVVFVGVALCQQFVGKQVRAGHADVLDVQAEMLRSIGGKACLCTLCQHPGTAGRRDKRDHAIARSQILIHLPRLAIMREQCTPECVRSHLHCLLRPFPVSCS